MIVNGIYTGLTFSVYDIDNGTDLTAADAFLQDLVTRNNQDSVVSIYMIPSGFSPASPSAASPTVLSQGIAKWASLDGYTPKNKKLLTYP